MRRMVTGLVLALWLCGCGLAPAPHDSSPSGAMAHMGYDLNWEPCSAGVSVTGVIVPGGAGDAEIKDDQGVVRSLVWGTHNTAVADWGRRYKIGGRWFNTEASLWACAGADAVSPQ
ncbi:MAG: hypothetical protein QOI00_1682 [Chloroflexota bacterium]|nr:hypothetical protein [Chloroflexota bacterium]